MEWIKLDIRKASVLKKQVDLALLTLKQSILEQDHAKRIALCASFTRQIDAIEEFRATYDSDERSILFERERLRLRKALQETAAAGQHTKSPSASANAEHGYTHDIDISPDSPIKSAASASASMHTPRSPDSPSKSRLAASVLGRAGNHAHREDTPGLGQGRAGQPPKTDGTMGIALGNLSHNPTKKIYAWEKGNHNIRTSIAIENAKFSPATMPGIYVRDDTIFAGGGAGASNESKANTGTENGTDVTTGDGSRYISSTATNKSHVDLYVILTSDEINILASRLQHKKAVDIKLFKNHGASIGIQHSTPFIDQSRIQQQLLRPEQPEKWLDKSTMRPNAK